MKQSDWDAEKKWLLGSIGTLKAKVAGLEAEVADLKKNNFQQGFHIAELQGELSLAQMQEAELVELLEKSHAECNDLSNEKLEILDRLVRLESENATLKAKAEKEYRGYKFNSTI